ncbi:selenocysteine insertion sequence-binding protein 2 isoform X2 [Sphaeramia orbicularis]|nr:selenocysteine insertion sequence-binding protein 2 isoform X2 [Sphaeramia orbicularis]
MDDFPELAGVPMGKVDPPLVQNESWRPPSQSAWKLGKKGSSTQPGPPQCATEVKPDSPDTILDQPAVAQSSCFAPVLSSWANVASQPPKKIIQQQQTISSNSMQVEETPAQQEESAPGKKKRKKKKKKAKHAGEETESEELLLHQEPPKFEDEEEFPGLTPVLTDRLIIHSNTAKLCNDENQRQNVQHQSAENKEKTNTAKSLPTEITKKGQKAEKVSGKKSKVPVQLDIGNMLAVLEKKQQSQKTKQDAKPVILSVGGGLPVAHKQPTAQKKPPWQQEKIAHNPLDSTSPLVKKGKQREVPRAKKPTALKKVILKEREERKQRRLLEEKGLLPENEPKAVLDSAEEEQSKANTEDEICVPVIEGDDELELNGTKQMVRDDDDEETDKEESVEQQTISPVTMPDHRPKIHSRKFRDYCSQMLSKDVDECVTTLLKELVRFQDRLYQKDPMKARMKRRIVMGLREVLKHLKLRKVKCVIISPNCERIQSKGGLDEALHNIIDTCREQGVPFVFALTRKALGRCVNKAVPVSLVGIFNYDGAQDFYHKMIELSSEARKAYEVMVLSLEQTEQLEEEQAANTEELQISSPRPAEEMQSGPEITQPEEPQYIKTWKKMLEKESNHKFLNFEEQLSSMHLDSECSEHSGEDEKS